jgi:hypothetical protein
VGGLIVGLGRTGLLLDRDPSIRMRFDRAVSTNVCHQSALDRYANALRVLYGGKSGR